MANLRRPEGAKSKLSFDGMLKSPLEYTLSIHMTTPAAGAALPTFSAVVQEFKTGDEIQSDAVCSGTFKKVGNTIGILKHDELVSIDTDYCTKAEKILVPMAAGQSSSQGNLCFIDFTTMTCYSSMAGNRLPIGVFLESADRANPAGLPAGDWALINFDGRADTWQS